MVTQVGKLKDKCVLCIDPSFAALGYAVIEPRGDYIIASGCIKTVSKRNVRKERAGDDRVRRIRIINTGLNALLDRYNIIHIVSDLPYGSQHASSAWALGCVVGLVQTIADCWKLSIDWYYEKEAKEYIRVPRNASKEVIGNKMKKRYGGGEGWMTGVKSTDQAVADALLAYTLATHASPVVQLLKNN